MRKLSTIIRAMATAIKMAYWIYTITRRVTGKTYVGVTQYPHRRRWEHQHANTEIGEAIRIYGKIQFDFKVIETNQDRRTAYAREQYWIAQHRVMRGGSYNPINKGNPQPTANARYLK